jgi:ubiquinone/menaquinone biosynthesis C-methylase UbiE
MSAKDAREREAAAYYDDFAARYDADRRAGYFGFLNDLEFEMLAPLAEGRAALEVGCGTGLILKRVATVAAEARGVDLSEGMVAACAAKGLDARQGSATDLPFEDDAFDVTYSFKVLPHVPEVRSAVAEMARVTRPGGRLLLEFYNPLSLKGAADGIRALARRKPVYLRHDRPRAVRRYLPPRGRVVRTRGIRIFGPTAGCYTRPVLRRLVRKLDRLACDGPLRTFAGYMLFEVALDETVS